MRFRKDDIWVLLPVAIAFAVYLVTFASIGSDIPPYPDWIFFADNREGILRNVYSVTNQFSVAKHPLYPKVMRPLFRTGLVLFGDNPQGLKYALAFPSALVGSATVGLAFLTFARAHPDRWLTWIFTLLYAGALSTWVFSSFPETQVLTSACAALFVALLLHVDPRTTVGVAILAAANAAACWASPQCLFLSVIVGVRYLQDDRLSAALVKNVARYAAFLAAFWVVPYYVWLTFGEFSWRVPHEYVNENVAFHPGFVLSVPISLLVFGVAGPKIHPEQYTDPALTFLTNTPLVSWVAMLAYVAIVAFAVRGLKTSTSRYATYTLGLLGFAVVYVLFFVAFNPREAYLMSMILCFPLLVLLHAGFAGHLDRRMRFVLLAAVFAVIAGNIQMIVHIRHLADTPKTEAVSDRDAAQPCSSDFAVRSSPSTAS